MTPLLRKGSRQKKSCASSHLTHSDLYQLPPALSSKNNALSEYAQRRTTQTFEINNNPTETQKTSPSPPPSLLPHLFKIAKPTFLPAGCCQLAAVASQIAIPLFVRSILLVLERNPYHSIFSEALPYVLLLFLSNVINAFANHRHLHLSFTSGIAVRTAVISAVYTKLLALGPEGREGLNDSVVTNLVAIDAQKIFEVMQEGHLAWSCPLAMVSVTVLLLLIMGPVTIVGMAVLVLLLPTVNAIVGRMVTLRETRVGYTDERVEDITAALRGVRVTKLNSFEEKFIERILGAREREVRFLRRELMMWSSTLVVTVFTPIIASSVTFMLYVAMGNVMTASSVFTILQLFVALRFPINYAGKLLGKVAAGYQALKRIEMFLAREGSMEGRAWGGEECEDGEVTLDVADGEFSVGPCFSLRGVSFCVSPGEIMAVIGPVGAGKSTLVKGLIGEVRTSPGTRVSVRGRIGYASQIPFIMNATLRDNILFGLPYDPVRYDKVLEATCLKRDIELLGEGGDLTEIGERGVTLSGGQKQRVSLARLAYSRPQIAILDDPLSALDATTGRAVFSRLFDEEGGLLARAASVLVTHANAVLPRVHRIMVMGGGRDDLGRVVFQGTWKELGTFEGETEEDKSFLESVRGGDTDDAAASTNSTLQRESIPIESETTSSPSSSCPPIKKTSLMTVEEREHGLASLQIWLTWFRYAGGFPFLAILASFLFLDRAAYVLTEWWLTVWSRSSTNDATPTTVVNGITLPSQYETQAPYVIIYSILLAVSFTFTTARSLYVVKGGISCSVALFQRAVKRLLHAPMWYFETTPLGRIINRVTFDVEALDITLTQNMSITLIACSWFVAGVVVMLSIVPWIGLVMIPVVAAYGKLQLHYRRSGSDLQRLDVVSRGPVQAAVEEAIDGATTIRLYNKTPHFTIQFFNKLDINSAAMLNFISAHRWLSVRIELMGSLITVSACLMVIAFNDNFGLNAGLVALLIIWTTNFTITLGFLVDSIAESEAAITSLERLHALTLLPQEPTASSPQQQLLASWPQNGHLQFQNVSYRYRPSLPLSLTDLTFSLPPGQRCGVVGRTGAGKSTLTTALFRLGPLETGKILLDGVDLSTLDLRQVRGRLGGMSIIPQDPVLFGRTVRECLDPFGRERDDGELKDALMAVRLRYDLDDEVTDGGSNYSVGERQLLSLARAILTKPKVLVLDEATASVDGETDAVIQQMLRRVFTDTTLVTIAHRLNTIVDYDWILVLEGGRGVEWGRPEELLRKETGGRFRSLVEDLGEGEGEVVKRAILEADERRKLLNVENIQRK